MEPRDVVQEAERILDRGARNVLNVFIVLGVRFNPATIETIRGILSAAIAEGIALGERYARWHRGTPPTRIDARDEDVRDTRPGFKSRIPPR